MVSFLNDLKCTRLPQNEFGRDGLGSAIFVANVSARKSQSATHVSKNKKICIITQLHPSMNPRVVKEADALVENGFKVSVVAPDFSNWGRKADEEFRNRDWGVAARPQFGPLSPWPIRATELLRRCVAGIATKHLGIMHPAVVRAAWHPVAPALVAAAKRQKADLYIAHLATALPAAAIAARHNNALYAYDAEDFHQGEYDDTSSSCIKRTLVKAIESRYLANCCYVTAASPLIAEAYRDAYKIMEPHVVLNVFPANRAPRGPTAAGTVLPRPSIYWFSQTIGPDRGLECAIAAIGSAESQPHLYLRGEISSAFRSRLSDLAATAGVADRLHILPRVAPRELEQSAAAFDLGFVGETGKTHNRRISLTNKQFSYLLAGLPVVMSDVPAHCKFASGLQSAISVYRTDDPLSLASAFDRLLLAPNHLAAARLAAYRLGQDRFNWELEREKLLGVVQQSLLQKPTVALRR